MEQGEAVFFHVQQLEGEGGEGRRLASRGHDGEAVARAGQDEGGGAGEGEGHVRFDPSLSRRLEQGAAEGLGVLEGAAEAEEVEEHERLASDFEARGEGAAQLEERLRRRQGPGRVQPAKHIEARVCLSSSGTIRSDAAARRWRAGARRGRPRRRPVRPVSSRPGPGAPVNRGPCGRSASRPRAGSWRRGRRRSAPGPSASGPRPAAGGPRWWRAGVAAHARGKPARSRTRTAKRPGAQEGGEGGHGLGQEPGLRPRARAGPAAREALEVGAGARRGGRVEAVARIHPGHELARAGGLRPRPRAGGRCGPTRRGRAPRTSARAGNRRGAGRRCRAGRWAGVWPGPPPQGRGFGLEAAGLEQPFERRLGGGAAEGGSTTTGSTGRGGGGGGASGSAGDGPSTGRAGGTAGRADMAETPSLFLRQSCHRPGTELPQGPNEPSWTRILGSSSQRVATVLPSGRGDSAAPGPDGVRTRLRRVLGAREREPAGGRRSGAGSLRPPRGRRRPRHRP